MSLHMSRLIGVVTSRSNFNITPWNPNTALSFILIVVAVGFCGSNLAEMARCRAKQVA